MPKAFWFLINLCFVLFFVVPFGGAILAVVVCKNYFTDKYYRIRFKSGWIWIYPKMQDAPKTEGVPHKQE